MTQTIWASSPSASVGDGVAKVWKLLAGHRGTELVWKLEELLASRVDRMMVCEWLRQVLRPPVLNDDRRDICTIACALLLVGEWSDADVQLLRKAALPRDPRLAAILGETDSHVEADTPFVSLLKTARSTFEAGDAAASAILYAKANASSIATEAHGPLLTYFALQGHADALAPNGLSTETLDAWDEAWEQARRAREHSHVRQWQSRIKQLQSSLHSARISFLEQQVSLPGYEARSASFSNSGSQLYVILQDAINLGAPLSVQAELTRPLLGALHSDDVELEERLRLNLDKPGEWLNRRLRSGDAFRNRSKTFVADYAQAGGEERRSGAETIGEILFPSESAQGRSPDGIPGDKIPRRTRAMLNVLENAAEIVRHKDIERAVDTIESFRLSQRERTIGKAASAIAHVCSWADVKRLLLPCHDSADVLDFQDNAQRFPWRHWALCDDFLSEEEHGHEFVAALASGAAGIERMSAGWALVHALMNSPDNAQLVTTCREFSERVILSQSGAPNIASVEQVANFASWSSTFCARSPQTIEWLKDRLARDDKITRAILIGSSACPDLTERAKESLRRSGCNPTDLTSGVQFAVFGEARATIDASHVVSELGKSWRNLRELAPVLHPKFWADDGWKKVQFLLRVGGHRGKSSSWSVGRVNLVVDALDHPESRETLFDDSCRGLGFLRSVIVDALGGGDGVLANNAVYAFAPLARHTQTDAEAHALAAALLAAADDVRIGVAHGASFVANYLRQYGARCRVHDELMNAAQLVTTQLAEDPLAMVRRQAVFGAKCGAHDATMAHPPGAA